MTTENVRTLQFAPFNSFVHPGFWNAFSKMKLDVLGLTEKSVSDHLIWYLIQKGVDRLTASRVDR